MRSLFAVGLLVLGPALASAKNIEGIVVRVADGEVVVDLGTQTGLPPTARLKVFRRLVVTHPVTKKPIEDRFPIGEVNTAAVGDLLSIVTKVDGLSRPPEVGDYVVYGPQPKLPQVSEGPVPEAPVADSQTAAVQATVVHNLGRSIDERIAAYEALLRAFPEGPQTDAVGSELIALRAVRAQLRDKTVVATPTEPQPPTSFTVRHANPRWTREGDLIQLAAAVVEQEWVTEVRTLARRRGDPAWQTLPMARDGDYHYRLTLPAALTAKAGAVEYVIEAVRTDAVLEPIAGTVRKPMQIEVAPPPAPETAPGATEVTAMARYVDFNSGGEATDAYFQFEAGVQYQIQWRWLQAVRFGVGTVDGEGGPTEAIDTGAPTRTLNVNYSFAEVEVAPPTWEWVGVAVRVMGGNHRNTDDSTSTAVTGTEGRLRIGRIDETRLVMGVSAFQDLGTQAFTDLHIEVFDGIPLAAGVAVTNLPVDTDNGVRLYASGGYEVLDWMTLVLETGWNARTINHNGFTAGGGLALNW